MSATKPAWEPTSRLRWWNPKRASADSRLQQLWVNGVDEKWMDIEVVCEWEENRKELRKDE
jgi:hypothetical protein